MTMTIVSVVHQRVKGEAAPKWVATLWRWAAPIQSVRSDALSEALTVAETFGQNTY